jgi:hypothetical protein
VPVSGVSFTGCEAMQAMSESQIAVLKKARERLVTLKERL